MRCTAVMLAITFAAGISLGLLASQPTHDEPEGIKRTMLLKTDLAGIEDREVVIGLAEVAPGVAAGRHYHDGDELGYVLEGTALFGGRWPDTY
jgi:quercetin dioxygenase-like cupin family protein